MSHGYHNPVKSHAQWRVKCRRNDNKQSSPEFRSPPQDIEVSLISASGGGVIGDQNTIVITIEANDDPHGVVEFAREINRVVEVEGINSQADIPVIRR